MRSRARSAMRTPASARCPRAAGACARAASSGGLPDGIRALIGRILGKLVEKNPLQVVVVSHGVGYEIDVPMSTFYHLPRSGDDVELLTHLVVRSSTSS